MKKLGFYTASFFFLPNLLLGIVSLPIWYLFLKPLFKIMDSVANTKHDYNNINYEVILLLPYVDYFLFLISYPYFVDYYGLTTEQGQTIAYIFTCFIFYGMFYILYVATETSMYQPANKQKTITMLNMICMFKAMVNKLPIVAILFISLNSNAQNIVETKEYKYLANPACNEITLYPTDSLNLDVWLKNYTDEDRDSSYSDELICLGVKQVTIHHSYYPNVMCTVVNHNGDISRGYMLNADYKPNTIRLIQLHHTFEDTMKWYEYRPIHALIPALLNR